MVIAFPVRFFVCVFVAFSRALITPARLEVNKMVQSATEIKEMTVGFVVAFFCFVPAKD